MKQKPIINKLAELNIVLRNNESEDYKWVGSTVKGGLYEVWYTLENEKIANKRKFITEEEANDFYDNLLEEKEFNYVVALDLLYGGRQLRSWFSK